MAKIQNETAYKAAMERIEELLPLVDDNIPANDKNAVELSVMSDIVIAYGKEHYPIEKPTVAELIELYLEEKGMSQKQLAIGAWSKSLTSQRLSYRTLRAHP